MQSDTGEEQQVSNKRSLAGKTSSASSANQKRASFGHGQQMMRSGSDQGSFSSQGSLATSASGSGAAPIRRRRPPPLRRQASSMESQGRAGQQNGSLEEQQQHGEHEEHEENLPPTSNADYERIRNETLLFFLDRLYLASTEGKKARTLQDLSCLFGTREFTRDMRQIVGASKNGLRKFLQSFPSLFQIEGDLVYLTQLKQDTQGTVRDYNKEAVDYFKQKLLQFGTSLVPIRNLFGYRSQASQEVRHVSGKNARDFRRFLKANEDVFELLADGEHVMLKSVLKELELEGSSLLSLQQSSLGALAARVSSADGQTNGPAGATDCRTVVGATKEDAVAMDPYLNKRFAHLIEQCLRGMQASVEEKHQFRVTLEELHEKIKLDCRNELFLKMVNTIDDLKVFLRMHPKLFRRFKAADEHQQERDYVSLLDDEERRELEARLGAASNSHGASLLHQSQLVARQHSALEPSQLLFAASKRAAQEPEAPKEQRQDASLSKTRAETGSLPSERKEGAHCEVAKTEDGKSSKSMQPKRKTNASPENERGSDSIRNSSQKPQLRANAPPFVPHAPRLRYQEEPAQQHQQQLQLQRSVSNLGPRREPFQVSSSHHNSSHYERSSSRRFPTLPPVDQRSAIRNYLTRPSTGQHSNNLHWANPNTSRSRHHQPTSRQSLASGDPVHPHTYGPPPAIHVQASKQPMPVSAASGTSGQASSAMEDLRARTVDMVREASNIITRIMNTTDAVAFDCKGYNLGFDGQITLIQFGFLPSKSDGLTSKTIDNLPSTTGAANENNNNNNNKNDNIEEEHKSKRRPKPEVCVFDLITNPELAYCLKPLLESDKIVKIVHDVRNKSNALYVQFKIILNNVFDTQVANLVIQQQDTGRPAYKSRYISMSKLCEVYGGDELLKYRNLIKSKTRHSSTSGSGSSSLSRLKDVNYWRTRPLSRPMIIESTMDVYCLIGGIYQALKSKLKPEYEPLFEQLNVEGVLARIKPDEIRSAKKGRKIDLEVLDLKRKLYRDSTGPVVLSNREIRLLRHIDLTEEVRQKIQQCKKVAKKIERLDMKAQQQTLNGQSGEQTHNNRDPSDPHSLISSSSTGETSLSTTTTSTNSSTSEQQLVEDEERILSSFMDSSSMFDELKDKIIESSNLLDSIEDSLRTPL